MAPTEDVVVWQTSEIIKYLFDNKDHAELHGFTADELETDGPAENGSFDPVLIAGRLRNFADDLNDNAEFIAARRDLTDAVAQVAVEAAYSRGVEAFRHTQVAPEIAPEMQLIKASVSFGLYVVKSSPELKNKVQRAMTAFLNSNVRTWVAQQGGWDNVNV